MTIDETNKDLAEDIYAKLLESQVHYLVFDDPKKEYTHLTNEEKKQVKAYILDDSYLWDYAPIAEFITANVPNTFKSYNYEKLNVQFNKNDYQRGIYPKDIHKEEINYRLYQNYLLNFEYGIGNTPVCFDEFMSNEMQSEDYLESIEGIEL